MIFIQYNIRCLLFLMSLGASSFASELEDSILKQGTFDVTVIMYPTSIGFSEFYAISSDYYLNERWGIDLGCNSSFYKKNYEIGSTILFQIGSGASFRVFPKRKFYLDPFARVVYEKLYVTSYQLDYSGGGIQYGFRLGYDWGRLGIGIKVHSSFTTGRVHKPFQPPPFNNHKAGHFILYMGGINVKYNFNHD